jgi:hypothetical protein
MRRKCGLPSSRRTSAIFRATVRGVTQSRATTFRKGAIARRSRGELDGGPTWHFSRLDFHKRRSGARGVWCVVGLQAFNRTNDRFRVSVHLCDVRDRRCRVASWSWYPLWRDQNNPLTLAISSRGLLIPTFQFESRPAQRVSPGRGDHGISHAINATSRLVVTRRAAAWLRRVFREAVCRDQATIFRLQPAAPVRRSGVADIGDGITASARRRRHSPARNTPRHRRQVADVSVHHAEQRGDGGLVCVME